MRNKFFIVTALCLLLAFSVKAQPGPLAGAHWILWGDIQDTVSGPCPVFIRALDVRKPLRSATLWITAHGLYKAELNGKNVTSTLFNPGYTAYEQRLQYQSYDVTKLLTTANNKLTVTLADGWWRGEIYAAKNVYGKDLSLLCRLQLTYKDGSIENIYSDKNWRCGNGPYRNASIYNGETFDRRIAALQNSVPVKVADYSKPLIPTEGNPVKRHEVFKSVCLKNNILDFGQNMAGWLRLHIKAHRGDTIRLQFAEMLDGKGDLYRSVLRDARATDIYVAGSDQPETYEPYFTYHGFRYAQIVQIRSGQPVPLKPANYSAEAIALYSDVKFNGTFACSDDRLNKLHSNIVWSMKGNFFDVPTDCPQRSERVGWTEDADVFCPTACYLADVKQFYEKWLHDLSAEQFPSGCVPVTVPSAYGRGHEFGMSGWSDAAIMTPWTLYQHYGDIAALAKQYASMKGWINYIAKISPDDRWTAKGFGDWLPSGPGTEIRYLNQCYWYRNAMTMVKAAEVLGKSGDVETYRHMAARVKSAFTADWTANTPQTQAAYVIGIRFGLLPDTCMNGLIRLIHASKDHLATGFMGTPNLLPVLSEHDQTDLAYQLLMQESMPSWLYMVKSGATTMWEKWDGIKPDGSLHSDVSYNHYAFGSVGNWLYENIAGIQVGAPGYKKIIIAPKVGGHLTWAKGTYRCSYGLISSEWRRTGDQLTLNVKIPPGTRAIIVVPGGNTVETGPGTYQYKGNLKKSNE